ncbi:ImmA/IrrE family metallo-endopeptidase [Burkholderia stagnalis]|uniref:ImmA/IrrE family metallo-endopeptidase n=1 Tax=Burkholderia stagnalis TaxID=1503054 RepID=UPI000F58E768|nr:hypothetical protein [Burkholderia stagnalis]MDY7806445.1 hypothetical protein [Burkholderia stagnalis]RQQ42006.1 hypothetical protein DF145_33565 [Burkholderia stagnalis]RQX87141.1 hypothetical protein DF121_34230 [Burkholderia stagnalis]RQY07229.1 hypothetical protein DF115_34260 [Burkholderia stagnalis]RQY22279.1 hypothetical protein DF114_33980 [Burkholderia stagnalis]
MARVSGIEIQLRAQRFCKYLRIDRNTRNNIARFLETLALHAICIDPVDDDDWIWVTDAICDPSSFRILIPDSTYVAACKGNQEALGVIFHEIGHLMLSHRAVLHNNKSAPPCQEEDAEWQADRFAAYVIARMGLAPYGQLSLDF